MPNRLGKFLPWKYSLTMGLRNLLVPWKVILASTRNMKRGLIVDLATVPAHTVTAKVVLRASPVLSS